MSDDVLVLRHITDQLRALADDGPPIDNAAVLRNFADVLRSRSEDAKRERHGVVILRWSEVDALVLTIDEMLGR